MKKKIMAFMLLFGIITACETKEKEQISEKNAQIQVLQERLRKAATPKGKLTQESLSVITSMEKDPVANELMQVENRMTERTITDFHNLSQVDWKSLNTNALNSSNMEQMIKAHEDAGMTHAKEYIEDQARLLMSIQKIAKKYPEFSKLSFEERTRVIYELRKKNGKVAISENLIKERVENTKNNLNK